MKIAIFILNNPFEKIVGGIESVVYNLSKSFAKLGHEVWVVCLGNVKNETIEKKEGVKKIGADQVVFRESNLIEEIGKIKEIVINKQSHFDRRTDFHHHFICRKCGKIEDVETPLCKYTCKKIEQKGYVVEEIEYKFYGLCDKCAER